MDTWTEITLVFIYFDKAWNSKLDQTKVQLNIINLVC